MQPSDLASLPVCDRLMYVMEHGHFVVSDDKTLSVYHMVDDFHVEVRLKDDRVSLLDAAPFIGGERYERVLACIDITAILVIDD